MNRDATTRPNIVGVGNTLMGDDGVGVAAVEALAHTRAARRARLIDAGLAFSEVLCDLQPTDPLIVIDAVRGPGGPGSVYRLGLEDLRADEAGLTPALSLHEVSVLPALLLEALSGRDFADVTIFGVEPERVAWGQGLSPTVAGAMDKLVRAVIADLDRRRRGERPPQASANPLARGSTRT